MKSKRHSKILELISDHAIETQEELLKKLNENGFHVTQATVSRDIKELRLIKAQDNNGKYCYTLNKKYDTSSSIQLESIITTSVETIDYAQNMVVIKCLTGTANAVCVALDAVHWNGVVGTLAGDDTIFVVMRNENYSIELVDQLKKLTNRLAKD